ncbi:serine/threonine-protein kinase MARK1-like [Plectropomus leopardus]|uniref:serine/threonine-protein kinase MARK1-like n=1 Tax=Plectropomus leopardus TaxID=160734 RepID=UPI001C4D2326|nr:serine/threonine-protein kinase MARK1-like [Plectropomus leopardus]
MSTDCENLLKKLLVLNPGKRGSLQQIMKDRWMNIGYSEKELKTYSEPEQDFNDFARIELMETMGFPQEEVLRALEGQKYNEATAVYLLLGRKPAEVRDPRRRLLSDTCRAAKGRRGDMRSSRGN